MQFPVPQFTDVEDKIIGSLTLKQFGIIFGTGIIVFLAYSSTKSIIVVIFVFLLFGLPGLVVAFAQINGRPIYNSFGYFVKFFLSPKVLVFHREIHSLNSDTKLKDVEVAAKPAEKLPVADAKSRLKAVNSLLQKQALEEQDLLRQSG